MKLRASFVVLALGLAAGGSYAADAPQVDVLGKGPVWRSFRQRMSKPVTLPVGHKGGWPGGELVHCPTTAAPPPGWAQVDFDDQQWAFASDVARPFWGAWQDVGDCFLASIQMRTRFGISDPAKVKGLVLSLAYRGGVTVYVNGKEVARKDMPAGVVDSTTPALDYPIEPFTGPEGKFPLPKQPEVLADADPNTPYYKMRVRTAEFPIPADALRAGTNVLAIQSSRSPIRVEALNRAGKHIGVDPGSAAWPTVGLVSAKLRAPAAEGLQAPALPAVRMWNAGTMTMVGVEAGEPDPLAELRPIKLQSPLGGDASGQVVVSADAPLTGLAAVCSDLAGPDGAKIPAGALRVRYSQAGGAYVNRTNPFDALTDQPMADAKLQPVWVTATVPAGVKPGTYTGTLSISCGAGVSPAPAAGTAAPQVNGPTTAKVPLELTVHGWTLPEPRQWKSMTSFFQSPETLARYYKVPLWSDAHFKLIEQSLILQGKLGDRVAHVLAVGADTGNASLGAESMVLYRREGNKRTPDFSAVERYLKLYKKHVGDPIAVILHAWTIHSEKGRNPNKDRALSASFRVGDKVERGTIPFYNDPSVDGLWEEMVAGIRRIMKGLDWPENSLVFGMSEDTQTGKETTEFFARHFPDIKWAVLSHMTAVAPPLKLWGHFCPTGYGDYTQHRQGWKPSAARRYPQFSLQRAQLDVQTPITGFRYSPIATLLGGSNGPGGNGMDRWTDKATGCYGLGWGQIMRGNPSSVLAPGPDGPVATVRYEAMRAGFIEAQAMIYVDDNAGDPKLPSPLAARAKAECQRLAGSIGIMDHRANACWEEEIGNLYQTAAEMQAVLGPGAP